ncbi:MAG: hypothetical protein GWN01_12920 [Nitrosopumilaceae archaeon]|nr:hypothetical protein [Nitrosopumilaceae archaeon]NIU01766.1 hypothetical protein [Nitrosopumilaceae archaeon]NIU88166.1 hypothetical protein [Nitrosopumilaceae archaeon]NIV66489.1 hypothetical protein [Nitrosopumilaceae archaeon]NIX62368.1 hypothetical protein [Nitrosopumilaceae archaeon]
MGKDYCRLWSSGQIQDDMFVSAIKHLINNDVIHSKLDLVLDDSDITIPE